MLTDNLIAAARTEADRFYDGKISSADARLTFARIARSGWHGEPYAALVAEFDAHVQYRVIIACIEAEYDQTVVAVAYNADDGAVYDYCFTWQTGQTMALEGYIVKAIADDGHMTKDDAQRLYDAEKERHDDCFGV